MGKKSLKRQIYLHLGLIKTATTFLQREVFPQLSINYYEKPDILRQEFDGNKILISNEEWCHNKYVPNNPELLDFDFVTIKKLAKLFPGARIVLGTRGEGFEKSLYSRFLLAGTTLSYNEFKRRLNKDFLNQIRYIIECRKLFGEVLIYTMKDLKKNPQGIVNDICNFMNVPTLNIDNDKRYNISLKPMQQKVLRVLNTFKIFRIPGFKTLFNNYIRPI